VQDRYNELAIEFRDYSVADTENFIKTQIEGWKVLIKATGADQK
jgi:hypothetical protein